MAVFHTYVIIMPLTVLRTLLTWVGVACSWLSSGRHMVVPLVLSSCSWELFYLLAGSACCSFQMPLHTAPITRSETAQHMINLFWDLPYRQGADKLAMLPVDDRWQWYGQWLCSAEMRTTDTTPVWAAAFSVLFSVVKFAVPPNTLCYVVIWTHETPYTDKMNHQPPGVN